MAAVAPLALVTRKSLFSLTDVLPHLDVVSIREGDHVAHITSSDDSSPRSPAPSSFNLPSSSPSLSPSASRVSSSFVCSTCAVAFDTADDLREHAHSPWHVYNVQQSSAHKATVSEEHFTTLSLSSSSSSSAPVKSLPSPASDDDSADEEDLKHVMPALSLDDDDDGPTLAGAPRVSFSTSSQVVWVWRTLLAHPAHSSSLLFPARSSLYLRSLRFLPSLQRTAIFLSVGGRFSAALFHLSSPTHHRTFQRYTVRAKQGGSQTANDAANAGHQAKSIGSSIRRKEAVRYLEEVHRTLAEWREELSHCALVWLYAPGANRRLFFGRAVAKVEDKGGVKEVDVGWNKADQRIRGVPFSVYRPTFAEVQRVHKLLTTVEFVDRTEGEEEGDIDQAQLAVPVERKEMEEREPVEEEEKAPAVDCLLLAVEGGDVEELQRLHASGYERPTPRSGRLGLVPLVYHAVVHRRVALLPVLTSPPFSLPVDEQSIDDSSLSSSVCWSPLHFACAHSQADAVLALLRCGADPTAKDSRGLLPYACAAGDEGKVVRLAMRRWAGGEGEGKWEYAAAGFLPQKAMSEEEEEERRRREKEKERLKKQKQKERQKAKKEEDRKAEAEAAEARQRKEAAEVEQRQREEEKKAAAQAMEQAWVAREKAIEGMSERERRALAAERRLAASKAGGAGAAKCDKCQAPLIRVPFERLHYHYCSLACLNQHRELLEQKQPPPQQPTAAKAIGKRP